MTDEARPSFREVEVEGCKEVQVDRKWALVGGLVCFTLWFPVLFIR